MNLASIRRRALLLIPLLWTPSAYGHGIAGNRYFDGTLGFDDPAVADEAILPYFAHLDYPTQGSNVSDSRINWAFARLLTPTLAFTVDSGWIHQNWPVGHTSGFDKTDIGLKYEAFRDNRHEALVSVSLAWGIGHSGAQAVGADAPNTIQPGIFFGKGFGDLPETFSWLRPFAVTARSSTRSQSARERRRLHLILGSVASIPFSRPRSRPCTGAFRFSTAPSISRIGSMAVLRGRSL
jgi:hypothetical protein